MKTIVLIGRASDGTWDLHTPKTKSSIIVGNGDSFEEAREDFLECYKDLLQIYKDEGDEVPEDLVDLEFEYKYDLSCVFAEFPFLNITKLAERIGINHILLRQYRDGKTYISAERERMIRAELHKIGERMCELTEDAE